MSKVNPPEIDEETRIGGKKEAAFWGNMLEDKVADAFSEVTGKKVARKNMAIQHPKYPFIRVNLDRVVVGEEAFLEAKTCSAYKAKEWEDDEIPAAYIIQCQHGLAVTGKKYAYIATLIGGQKFIWKKIDRSEEIIERIITTEVTFWREFVEKKAPPFSTGSSVDAKILNNLYPISNGQCISLSSSFKKLLDERIKLTNDVKAREEEIARIENQIKEALGENEAGEVEGFFVTWKNQSRSSIDSALLKNKFADIYEQVKKATNYRVLRIVKKEDKNGN
jgi:putative phage-type endonuclease